MKTRDRFGYMVLGGVITVVALIVTSYDSHLSAKKEDFGEITCTGLTVLSPGGNGAIRLTVDDLGGLVGIYDKDGLLAASIGMDEDGAARQGFR